ncbi:hypothetical protein B7463_g5142, partial [Scytalidium lignicola]
MSTTEVDFRSRLRNNRRRQIITETITPNQSERSAISQDEAANKKKTLRNLITSIDSLLSFVDFLSSFPNHIFEKTLFSGFEPTAALLIGSKQVKTLGTGASFEIQVDQLNCLPEGAKGLFPEFEETKAVAVKIPLVQRTEDGQFDKEQELRCLKAIAWELHVLSHPPIHRCENIVNCYAVTWRPSLYGEAQGTRLLPALVMELADEGNLSDLLNSEFYCLTYELKQKLCLDVAQGLNVLHQYGIIHGDIKTENILLFNDSKAGLVAKIADFGFSVHDHSYDETVTAYFPGRSPPWDAPEISGEALSFSNMRQADLYSYGLSVWKTMLDGSTPFESTAESHQFSGFEKIIAAEGDAKRTLISELKNDPDDKFLELVKTTLPDKGLDEVKLCALFDLTLRKDPLARTRTVQNLIDILTDGSHKSAEVEGPVQDDLAPISNKENNGSVALSAFEDEYLSNRAFYGTRGPHSQVDILALYADTKLPYQVCQQLFEELSTDDKSYSNLNIALCHFIGFGVPVNPDLGIEFMVKAAQNGNLQAKALVTRLYQAYKGEFPDKLPHKDWLHDAVSAGSLIAEKDLNIVDKELYVTAIKECRQRWHGKMSMPLKILGEENPLRSFLSYYSLEEAIGSEDFLMQWLSDKSIEDVDIFHPLWTLMHFAAAFGYNQTVNRLLDIGVDVNATNALEETALMCASRAGRLSVVKILLDRGANAIMIDYTGITALHYIIYFDPEDVAEALDLMTEKGVNIHAVALPNEYTRSSFDFICEEPRYSGTALHWAIDANRVDVVEALLGHGAQPLRPDGLAEAMGNLDLDMSMDNSRTCVHFAALDAQADMIKLFLEKKGVRDVVTEVGPNSRLTLIALPFKLACIHGSTYKQNLISTSLLLTPPPEDTLIDFLGIAVLHNNIILAEYVLNQGCDINQVVPRPNLVPIQMACTKQSSEMVLFLLEHGANPSLHSPNCPSSCVILLAYIAFDARVLEVIKALVKAGITYKDESVAFSTMYHRAVKECRFDIALYLLSLPDCDKDELEKVLLWDLLYENSTASLAPLEFILQPQHQYGRVSVIADAKLQVTAFHLLAMIKEDVRNDDLNRKLAHYLLSLFPSPEILNQLTRKGETAIKMAVSTGNHHLVSALLAAGADPALGKWSANMEILSRSSVSKTQKGPFKGIAQRFRKAERMQDNTERMMTVMLNHRLLDQKPGVEEGDIQRVRQLLLKWDTAEYAQEGMRRALTKHFGSETVVDISEGYGFTVDEGKGEGIRKGRMEDVNLSLASIWEDMVAEWISECVGERSQQSQNEVSS